MNHNSDYSVIFVTIPCLIAIDVSSQIKLIHTRTDSPRFDSALTLSLHKISRENFFLPTASQKYAFFARKTPRNMYKFIFAQIDESLL